MNIQNFWLLDGGRLHYSHGVKLLHHLFQGILLNLANAFAGHAILGAEHIESWRRIVYSGPREEDVPLSGIKDFRSRLQEIALLLKINILNWINSIIWQIERSIESCVGVLTHVVMSCDRI